MTEYQVTGEVAHVTVEGQFGRQKHLLYKGSRFSAPPATDEEVTHLLSINVITELGGDPVGTHEVGAVAGGEVRAGLDGEPVQSAEPGVGRPVDAQQVVTTTGHGQAVTVTNSDEGGQTVARTADEQAADTEARRQAAREKLAKLGGKAPDGRHSEDVLIEYLVGQGSNYADLVNTDKADLVELVKARQS
ncbi:hypothetical protein [Verrucosispora sp. WMMC514]|uniref:hypothetical protein n=1 Tax=Verrucosispora sp. WMMC514 TaxID=3015156 RepID=UPI00248A90F1|nr:hypothetical protein [Verrucosispora sp. WMMC514]WBB94193.1 hypothetical protein O7597_15190 [Verrucosispora sp. WMMC514]